MSRLLPGLAALSLVALPAHGAEIALTLTLDGPGELRTVSYACDELDDRFEVTYIDAAPNFLALLTIDDQSLVFASALAPSTRRYVAAQYEWGTTGAKSFLIDLTDGHDAPPALTCLEANEIP